MAINRDAFELLCWAGRQSQKKWDRVLTLGRQAVVMQPWELGEWLKTSGGNKPFDSFLNCCDDASAGEKLFKHLGAGAVESMDMSDYEGASLIHNLNEAVPAHLRLSFDVVYDGGTLEHVFDYPTALCNALSMVKEGGWFLSITPSNMWCGHGFYQLGPDIFRTIMSGANGFELKLMAFALSTFEKSYWRWDPVDPGQAGRLGIYSHKPACLLIAAKRVSPVIVDTLRVQQPDYVSRWDSSPASLPQPARKTTKTAMQTVLSGIVRFLPWSVRGRLRHWYAWKKVASSHQRNLVRSRSL